MDEADVKIFVAILLQIQGPMIAEKFVKDSGVPLGTYRNWIQGKGSPERLAMKGAGFLARKLVSRQGANLVLKSMQLELKDAKQWIKNAERGSDEVLTESEAENIIEAHILRFRKSVRRKSAANKARTRSKKNSVVVLRPSE